MNKRVFVVLTVLLLGCGMLFGSASSHREAPGITKTPAIDGTDFYMFRSYESGRSAFATFVANYVPLQDAYGGPNYFALDADAVYEIHVDNNGDAIEDITFQFQPKNTLRNVSVNAGGVTVPIPLINAGQLGPGVDDVAALNREETFTVNIIRGRRRTGRSEPITQLSSGAAVFRKPVDNIGAKSIPLYETYARNHVYDIQIPGCQPGRMFVGQRKDPFVVNLGETFDLVNITNPLGPENAEADDLAYKNVTSFVLEVPLSCVVSSAGQPIIGGWTTASTGLGVVTPGAGPTCPPGQPAAPRPAASFVPSPDCIGWVPNTHPLAGPAPAVPPGTQWSRLGAPLVNEVVIGLPDKDTFNRSEPSGDGAFAKYVTNPTLPELLELLFGGAGVRAPNNFPRNDLVAAFLTGIAGVNQPPNVVASEMLRLNTSVAATPAGSQHRLGALGGDNAGFPNGRRPGDDVVDIALRVEMGVLCHAFPSAFGCGPTDAPSGTLAFTDGALVNATFFDATFPYLKTPLPGSPNGTP